MAKAYRVERDIAAPPEVIWRLVTDADRYPEWNPSVTSLRGSIEPGATIELRSSVNPKRAFSLKVDRLEPPREMVWSSGMPLGVFRGVRTFSLRSLGSDMTRFSMEEVYSGPLAPLIIKAIPDLDPSFAQFADGLKAAAEGVAKPA
jgi:hypothetical protein